MMFKLVTLIAACVAIITPPLRVFESAITENVGTEQSALHSSVEAASQNLKEALERVKIILPKEGFEEGL